MGEWLDISRETTPGMPVWPDDPPVAVSPVARIGENGAPSNVSQWSFSSHAGTHVDPPLHFIPGGSGADQLDLDALCGRCRVLDFTDADGHVSAAMLEDSGAAGEKRILLKTRNSFRSPDSFHEDYIALEPDAAAWLVEHGVALVGVDGPSVEAFTARDFAVHHTLLGNSVILVENLLLASVPAGSYDLVCAPLKWTGADGAPARVLLRTLTDRKEG